MSQYGDKYRPLDLNHVKTYKLASRSSKVSLRDFAQPIREESSLNEFLSSLPNILAVETLKNISAQLKRAHQLQKPIVWGLGGHVIKTGLAPLLIDLMKRGYLTAVAANGSVLVHDTEIAIAGSTSEHVDATLGDGAFGGAEETGFILNAAAKEGAKDNIGLGEALGRSLLNLNPQHRDVSVLCATYEAKVPFTAHLTIGGDIGHFHPSVDGAALGATTHRDFLLFADIVRQMDGGGVYLNVGSAVVLPEVFLKCVSLVRNLGHPLSDITTANFDFIQSYRPQTNVVRRPTADGAGQGYWITGHHELTIPLLAAMLITNETI